MSGVGSITISRKGAGGKYRDIIDVANTLSGRHGSATNAIAEMVRESASFKQAIQSLAKSRKVPRGTDKVPTQSCDAPPEGSGGSSADVDASATGRHQVRTMQSFEQLVSQLKESLRDERRRGAGGTGQ